MNIFDGLAKLFKPNPANVAARQATRQARIDANTAVKLARITGKYDYKNAKLDSGLTQDTADFWQGIGTDVYASAHAVGSGILDKFGIDASYSDTLPSQEMLMKAPPMSAPPPSTGIPTSALVVGGLAIVALAMANRK